MAPSGWRRALALLLVLLLVGCRQAQPGDILWSFPISRQLLDEGGQLRYGGLDSLAAPLAFLVFFPYALLLLTLMGIDVVLLPITGTRDVLMGHGGASVRDEDPRERLVIEQLDRAGEHAAAQTRLRRYLQRYPGDWKAVELMHRMRRAGHWR